jgi:hypothetical protein
VTTSVWKEASAATPAITSSIRPTVVGSILLAADQELGVEQLAVGAGADLVNWLWAPSVAAER